jgi:hypothetical protein
VYARKADETTLQLVGSTSAASYNAADLWAGDAATTPTVYAVAAVKSDGTESFLSNAVLNNDRDHDGLTDVEELQYGTNPDLADSDGDGYEDGEELLNGTNPTVKDKPYVQKDLSPILPLLLH